MDTKRCYSCGETLPVKSFSRNASKPDGLQVACKVCMKGLTEAWRDRNLERYYATVKDGMARWRAEDPRRARAHYAAKQAVKSGQIKRTSCAECGHPETEMHHESYEESQWLVVVHLCRPCHKARHAELRAQHRNQAPATERAAA